MDDSGKSNSKNKLLNPWMLHFQKLALELKCPLCLTLFKRPVLLPCDHLFCNSCLTDSTTDDSECAVCKIKYAQKDVRYVPFVQNMVAIYRSLDATFCANLFQQHSSDDLRVLEPCKTFLHSTCSNKKTDKVLQKSPSSDEVGVGKNHKSKITMHGKALELEMSCRGVTDFHSARKLDPMQYSRMETGDHVEMDMNQVTQSAPDSPPFCDTKGSDNDCSDQDSGHPINTEKLESSSLKRANIGNGNFKERMTQLRSESSASETEGLMSDFKRQKNLTSGNDHFQLGTTHHNTILNSHCDMDHKSGKDPSMLPPNDLNPSKSSCSFCQSSKTSEATGPMLHYVNGNFVTGDAVTQPNVIPVHKICIDWAPQVYFVDETVKNLKAEIARGAKLKCTKCGLKGAALGCYVKSCRRTYHVPCAIDISTCRWDHVDFLLLCPVHSHVKFPTEKSRHKKKAQKHPGSSHQPSYHSHLLEASQDGGKKMVFCGSALSNEEKLLLINFASRVGATVTKYWTSDVTHVIAATDVGGACSRTLKVLMAILNGRWILKMDWVKASMEVMNPVEEEPYEISLDNQGCHGGPKAGRLKALANERNLFWGLKFYFSGDYVSSYKEDLEDLVKVGGGTVLKSKDELEARRHECEVGSSNLLVVYNLDPPQGCKLGEEVSILWQRLNEAEDLAANTGYQVIGHTWILESIAACKLQPFVS